MTLQKDFDGAGLFAGRFFLLKTISNQLFKNTLFF